MSDGSGMGMWVVMLDGMVVFGVMCIDLWLIISEGEVEVVIIFVGVLFDIDLLCEFVEELLSNGSSSL